MSSAESSKQLDDSLGLPPPPLEREPPVESMALPLPTALTGLLYPMGLFCCPTVFAAFFVSILCHKFTQLLLISHL